MKFLQEPKHKNSPWLATQDHLTEADLRERILSSDVCLSDLDDCDADSPAKKITKQGIGTQNKKPLYRRWCFQTALALLFQGKKAETLAWKKYVETFLRDKEALTQVKKLFDFKQVKSSLYPGVVELYSLLNSDKYYITRNIREVAEEYARIFNFQGLFPETDHKEKFAEKFISSYPQYQRYFLKGDSEEDQLMLDVLKHYQKKGRIEQVLSCYRADKPTKRKMNLNFDINLGKDYSGLVEILRKP